MLKRRKLILLTCLVLAINMLTSCGTAAANIRSYSAPGQVKTVETGAVAQNDTHDLLWDADRACLILHNRLTGEIRSTIPYDYYLKGDDISDYQKLNFCSPVRLTCVDRYTAQSNIYYSDKLAQQNLIYSVKIKNGIRLIYIFEEIGVTVPIEYLLTDDGIEMRILVEEITEKDNLVYEIAPAPFFSAVKNSEESYLFVPSGCGALMYADESRSARNYSEPVYGEDASNQPLQAPASTQTVHLPVFGTSSPYGGVLGIIGEGSELGVIEASAGDSQLGYSAAYAAFRIRSMASSSMKNSNNTTQIVDKISPSKADISYVSVRYVLLDSAKCSYNDMAAYYRNFLVENKQLAVNEEKSGVFLNVIGGVQIQKSFLGVPYHTVFAATTLKETEDIVSTLTKELQSELTVKLNGFTVGGIDGSKIGGGFRLGGSTGNKKALQQLSETCKKSGVPLLMNFDVVNFNTSSAGFSVKFDSAKNANLVSVKKKSYSLVIQEELNLSDQTYFLARGKILPAVNKLIKKSDSFAVDGIALDSLGGVAYSDCSSAGYIAKQGMSGDVVKAISTLKKAGLATATENANLYAACADYVFSVPDTSSGYLYFDAEIPFYQMILKGSVSMSGESLNLSTDSKSLLLKAALTGCAVQFTVCNNFTDAFINTQHSGLAGSVFSDVRQDMVAADKALHEVWETVRGEQITFYERQGNTGHSVFSNGTEVYANFSGEKTETPVGILEGYTFKMMKGADGSNAANE